jgi:Tat protein secretion system quality control protein TatD with DNase activity
MKEIDDGTFRIIKQEIPKGHLVYFHCYPGTADLVEKLIKE